VSQLPELEILIRIAAHRGAFSTDNRLVHQKTTILAALILSRLALASGAQMLYLEVS
jgi:hypothetical protein